jgi:replicative DNA helicase
MSQTNSSNTFSGANESGAGRESGGFRGRGGKSFRPSTSSQKMFDKDAPHSIEAEKALLGSMILEPKIIPDVIGTVSNGKDFYLEAHGHIFAVLLEIYDRKDAGDLVQTVTLLRDRGVLDAIGGEEYLVDLANSVPTAVNAPHFAKIVAEKAKLRRLIDAAGEILYSAYNSGDLGVDGAREVIDKAESAVFEIAQEKTSSDMMSLAEILEEEMKRIAEMADGGVGMSGMATGFNDLDAMLLGLQPGELLILAARPSMGKTAMALNMAEGVATGAAPYPGAPHTRSVPVGFFSLEMSRSSVTLRMLCAKARVKSQDLRSGRRLAKQDLHNLGVAADELKSAPIYIDDTPGLTILNLRARARRMVQQFGVKALFIDYLQLLTAPGAGRESRQMEVAAISRGVKALARELNVPIVCLSQLNRAAESRDGNRPRMSDLRESGSIEQDADVIMLLHREDYYHKDDEQWLMENPDRVGLAEIIIAKQRNGPTGVVKLSWNSDITRFMDLDPHAVAPGAYNSIGAAFEAFPGGGTGSSSQVATSGNGPGNGHGNSYSHGQGNAQNGNFAAGNPGFSPSGQRNVPADAFGDAFDVPFDTAPDPRAAQGGQSPHGQYGTHGARPGGFAPGRKSGPIENHRDGGGPDSSLEDDLGLG